jgi:hypothetical protein
MSNLDDQPLDATPVFRKLDNRFNWGGLEIEDAPFAVLPMLLVFGGSIPFGYNPLWSLLVAAALLLGLILLKHGKPEGYLQTLLALRFSPRRLSHKEQDYLLDPFPLDDTLDRRS